MEANTMAEDRAIQDESVLKQYGLRWAVLAAWMDALQLRRMQLPQELSRLLENGRIKIASGCFSVCEVGCDLSQLEAALTSIDASSQHNWVDFWVDMLGHSMADKAETERILKVPAIRAHYNNCGITGCRC
jgi:hypothetical protein